MDLEGRLRGALATTSLPGAALAVWQDGRLVTAVAGTADTATGTPVADDTAFWLASTSKVVGATAALRLLGLDQLDHLVREAFPDLGLGRTPADARLTLRHLLSHTSGLDPDFFPDTGLGDDALAAYVARCVELEQVLPPDVTSYCTTGLILAGRLLELSCRSDWDTALRDHVLEPLRMRDTITIKQGPTGRRLARGHVLTPEGPLPLPPLAIPRAGGPAGGLRSSAGDVARFAAMHLSDGRGPTGDQVLRPEVVQEMQRPQSTPPGRATAFVPAAWGLGWALYRSDAGLLPGHDGGLPGFSSFVRLVPHANLAVVLLVNSDQAAALFRAVVQPVLLELAGVRIPDPVPAPQPATSLDPHPEWLGRFSRGRLTAEVSAGSDRLHVRWDEPPFLDGGEWTVRHEELIPDDLSCGRFLRAGTRDTGWEPTTFFRLPDGRPAMQHGAGALVRAPLTR